VDSDAGYWVKWTIGFVLMLASVALLVGCIVKLASIGTCASGGPYVSARPCPKHTEYWIFGIFGAVFLFIAGLWVFASRGGRGVKPGLATTQTERAPDWASLGGGNRGEGNPGMRFVATIPQGPAGVAATPPAAAPTPSPSPAPQGNDRIARLERLQKLREEGALTESEFEVEKAKILSGF
jgi:hypothetical protein